MVARSVDVMDTGHRVVLHAGSEPVVIPGGNALLTADFHRLGPDLFIHGQHGFEVLVHDYFSAHTPALITETGLSLAGDLITTLSRPEGYLQLAQDQTAQADVNGGAQPIGKVDTLSGSVDVHHTDGSTAHLTQGAPVFQNDVIQTGPDGQVDITFVDGTAFALSEGARMTLDDLVYNSDGKENSFTASVLQGTFIFTTGKIAPSGHMEVKTPVGTVGIRGTTVGCSIDVDGNDSTCTLFQDPAGKGGHTGKVEVTNAGGSQILDAPNASTRLTSFFAAPTTPFTLPPQDIPQLHDLLKQFYEQHGGTPTHQGHGDEPGKQGALHGDHIDQAALDQAIEDAENFSTAAGPGDAAPQNLGSSNFDPLAHLIGFVPPPSTPVSFTSLSLNGPVDFSTNDNSSDSFDDTGSHRTRDNDDPNTQSSPGGDGFTTINGTPGNDDLGSTAHTGPLIINGNDGDDVLNGSSFDDQLHGNGGNDTLNGNGGDDQAFGDAGNDTFDGGTGLGNDHYDGGDGIDTVEYTSATMNITVNLTTGTASGDPDIGSDTLVNIENVIGGSGNDTIIGNAVANELIGGAGNDRLTGLGGDDTLNGGIGTDVAVFSGLMADYSISRINNSTYIITDNHAGRDGTDTLVDVEQAHFKDGDINLADLPSKPVDTENTTNNAILENAAVGTLVGITANATTASGKTVTYSLVGDTSHGGFQIDPHTGVVTVADGSKIDYETAANHQYQITVQASDGSLSSQSTFTIGVGNESPANQIVSGDVTLGDPLIVGDTTNGYLDVQADGHALARQIIVGNHDGASGSMTLEAGSSAGFGADTTVTVGNAGTGYLYVFGSANAPSSVGANLLTIGEQSSGNGTVTVSGDGAVIATSGNNNAVWVGDNGVGHLIVQAGGQVKTLDFEIGIAGTGTATIMDSGSKVVVSNDTGLFGDPNPDDAGLVRVGVLAGSDGTLNIKAGGSLEIRAGQDDNGDRTNPSLIIAEDLGSKGSVNLDGVGSSLVMSMTAAADPLNIIDALNGPALIVGEMGQGQMAVDNQATVTLTGEEAYIDVGVGDSHKSTETTPPPQGSLQVSGGGQITVTDTNGTDGGLIVGDQAGGGGNVLVDGDGSSIILNSVGGAQIGRFGVGDLLVQNGGHVEITADGGNGLQLGSFAGSSGSVVVDGANSEIATHGTDNVVDVGYAGDGILSVTGGGLVSTLQLEIGRTGTGIVVIRGVGSTIVASNDGGRFSADSTEAGYVEVGGDTGSSGVLTIQEGGALIIRPGATINTDTTDAELNIAREVGSSGVVLLTGQGSHIDISTTAVADPHDLSEILLGPALVVGEMGNGQMLVTDKATVSVTGNEAYVDVGVGDWRNPENTTTLPQSVLQVRDGAQITVTDTTGGQGGLLVGDYLDGNGKLIVDGADAKITVISEGGARIGREGTGELDILNGGQVTITSNHGNNVEIGVEAGSTGTVTVDGPGSVLTTIGTRNGVFVGDEGTGELTVSHGGLVNTLDLEAGIEGQGSISITGEGSKIVVSNDTGLFVNSDEAGYVVIGAENGGVGNLAIDNGGSLDIRSGLTTNTDTTNPLLIIARDIGSIGTVTVDGVGSTITLSTTAAADPDNQSETLVGPGLDVGDSGNGMMTVSNHATVSITGQEAYLDVGVGDWQNQNSTTPLPQSVLRVETGGQITVTDTENGDGGLIIGDYRNGNGKIVVDGAGSAINILSQGGGTVGRTGNGDLEIQNGGHVTITSDQGNTLRIGQEADSNGTVAVRGNGSALTTKGADNIIEVGQNGTGNLTVSGGGLVSTLDFEIGIRGTGTATITGAGSKVVASNDDGNFTGSYTDEAGYVRVGNEAHSNGHLTISDGGLLEIRAGETINTDKTGPELDIASAKGSIGVVDVEGTHSAITVTGSDASIYVGLSGDGTLTIGQNATVDVTGDNATVAVGGNYDNPQDPSPTGSGMLDVHDGGKLTITGTEDAAATFTLGDEQNGNGQADIEGGEINIIGGSATIGNSGIGALTIGAGGDLVIRSLLNAGAAPSPASGLTIARNENSNGSVRISGANTQLQIISPNTGIGLMEGPFLIMAAGQSLFDVSDHAGVTLQGSGANMVIGSEATSIATADITGGATVTVDGQAGDATVVVANQIGSTGSLTIDGAGSHLTVQGNTAEMLIGANLNSNHSIAPSGEAHVTVSHGGTLDVGSDATHGTGATEIFIGAHGSLDIDGGTVLGDVSDQGGQIEIGHDVVSTATLFGNLDMSAPTSTLDIDASGTAPGQVDKLNVTGHVAMSEATIDFHFLSNYTPHAGDTFSFLTASGPISLNPDDLSVVAHNVDPDFRFEVQQSGQDVQFHALTDDYGGTSDVFLGGKHDDIFAATTGSSNNALFGGDGNDTLTGSNGGNLIQGGSGADHMTGGTGADTFSFTQTSDGTCVATNGAVPTNANYDHILDFDAAKDKLNFSSNYFHSAINSTNFSKISTAYDGTNGTSSAYTHGHESFILDSNNNLIYDKNGSGAGYTIVAHIDVANGSPAITASNLHADVHTA